MKASCENQPGWLAACSLYVNRHVFISSFLIDISKHYSQKASIEHEIPTATQKLVTTNDCILSSAVTLTNGAGKIASFFGNNVDYFIASLSYGPKTASGFISPLSAECMLQYKKKAAAYMKSLRTVRGVLLTIFYVLALCLVVLCWARPPQHPCLLLFFFWNVVFADSQSAILFRRISHKDVS